MPVTVQSPVSEDMAYLYVDWTLDGEWNGDCGTFGSIDVYINDTLVADDCTSYCELWPAGSKYEIKDIKSNTGYRYSGTASGALIGTVGDNEPTEWFYGRRSTSVSLKYESLVYFDVNWLLNGESVGSSETFGSVDIYINGILVADDCTDYCELWPVGTRFDITDIKTKTGYQFIATSTGALSGNMNGGSPSEWSNGYGVSSFVLSFSTKTQIISVSKRINSVRVTASCADADATIICAEYDTNGKMIGIESRPALIGQNTYDFSFPTAKNIKVFVLDAGFRPLCDSASR